MNTLFVIPHQGRTGLLRQTLQSVADQIGHAGAFEAVVVTKEAALEINPLLCGGTGEELPVTVMHVSRELTISAQRNLGARQAKSDHLAFLDADIELARDWLATMQYLLQADEKRVIVSAVQRCPARPTRLEVIRTDQSNVHVDADLQHLPGRNLFMRRRHFDALEGFPEHLSTCEDYHFTSRAARLGALHYSSASSYVHLGEDRHLLPMFIKEIWRGASNLQSTRGRPVGWLEWPSFMVPVWMVLALLIAFGAMLTGAGLVVVGALVAFVVPALLFAGRLRRKTDSEVGLVRMTLFYGLYFTARGLGMFIEALKALAKRSFRRTGNIQRSGEIR